MLSARHLSKRYGAVIALRDASFTLAPGEVRALYGGNGSGKSTAARILGGIVLPDSGEIAMDGAVLPRLSPRAAKDKGIGITFQELSLLPELTVAENLAFAHMPSTNWVFRDDRGIRDQAEAVLEQVGLAHLGPLPVAALQVGEKYLVEFAKVTLLRPRCILLDEITSGLHDSEAQIVRRILREHQAKGGAALFVSHRVREILEICDTITVLRNGSTVADEPVASVSADALLRWAGGGVEKRKAAATPKRDIAVPGAASDMRTRLSIPGLLLSRSPTPISFTLNRGEILGLGGLPDQGQNEILAALTGDRPGGSVLALDGQRLHLHTPQDAVKAGIAYVSGDRDEVGFRTISIAENARAALLNRRLPQGHNDAVVRRALQSMSTVYGRLSLPLASLSGGNQQKVLLARCFLLEPRLLIAADPTKGIDVAARVEVHRAIRRLAKEHGTAVVMSSSDDAELVDLCDRVLVMDRCRVKAELRRDAGSLDANTLIQAYLHQELPA